MTVSCISWALAALLLSTSAAWARLQAPIAVSPGDSAEQASIDSRCPTFSWGSVRAARAHELVVYRTGQPDEALEPVLQKRLPGSVTSWTPSLDSCLETGGKYAWSIRALAGARASDWSPPRFFQIVARSNGIEARPESRPSQGNLVHGSSKARRPSPPERTTSLPTADELAPGAGRAATPQPSTHAGTGGGIVVNGAVAETKADPPCYPSAGDSDQNDRFVNCGNGTVLDTVTGLLWLERANCRSCLTITCAPEDGLRNWFEANSFAASLRDGQCGLSDHSQPGDWRLATFGEWEVVYDSSCEPPSVVGRRGGCYSDENNGWALEVQPSRHWASSTWEANSSRAWVVHLRGCVPPQPGCSEFPLGKDSQAYSWPVRAAP